MKTRIYKSKSEFLERADKSENGVSQRFAHKHPDWEKMNQTNRACWNCSDCSYCSDCSDCYSCYSCSGCYDCSDCSNCYSCSGCYDCYDCSHCSDCYDCYYCYKCYGSNKNKSDVPVLKNIHQLVLAEIGKDGHLLDMSNWHACKTAHCRAGWVVFLSGEDGSRLEKETSTCFAAMQIYKASSEIRVSPVRFFESNEAAMKDIERCAKLEAEK